MKKAWMVTLGGATVLTALFFLGGALLGEQGDELMLTQQTKCIVLAKNGRELVVQCIERAGVAELRTVRLAQNERSNDTAVFTDDAVQVGDLVQMETELHSDNTETLRSVEVLGAGVVTEQEATAMLETARNPQAVAVTTQGELADAQNTQDTPDPQSAQDMQAAASSQNAQAASAAP